MKDKQTKYFSVSAISILSLTMIAMIWMAVKGTKEKFNTSLAVFLTEVIALVAIGYIDELLKKDDHA